MVNGSPYSDTFLDAYTFIRNNCSPEERAVIDGIHGNDAELCLAVGLWQCLYPFLTCIASTFPTTLPDRRYVLMEVGNGLQRHGETQAKYSGRFLAL